MICMKIVIDQNNLLSIDHPELPKIREYVYEVGWWRFSDWDKWLVVLHKKDFKVINLKNLGDGMSVVYIKKSHDIWFKLHDDFFKQAFGLFSWFDEVGWEQIYFFPGAHRNKNLASPLPCQRDFVSLPQILSFLYGLLLLYGKFDVKWNELLSLKIQLPLFGQYLSYQEKLDQLVVELQNSGIFIKKDVLETTNGIIYQMSSNDRELLEIFAKWYQSIEKFEKISKRDFTEEMKSKLVAFLVSDSNIPEQGKEDILEVLESWVIKLLMK